MTDQPEPNHWSDLAKELGAEAHPPAPPKPVAHVPPPVPRRVSEAPRTAPPPAASDWSALAADLGVASSPPPPARPPEPSVPRTEPVRQEQRPPRRDMPTTSRDGRNSVERNRDAKSHVEKNRDEKSRDEGSSGGKNVARATRTRAVRSRCQPGASRRVAKKHQRIASRRHQSNRTSKWKTCEPALSSKKSRRHSSSSSVANQLNLPLMRLRKVNARAGAAVAAARGRGRSGDRPPQQQQAPSRDPEVWDVDSAAIDEVADEHHDDAPEDADDRAPAPASSESGEERPTRSRRRRRRRGGRRDGEPRCQRLAR